MTRLPPTIQAALSCTNNTALTVTELTNAIKSLITTTFEYIAVYGEITSCKIHSSGHTYFVLKDGVNIINAICWYGTCIKQLNDGMQVLCHGKVTTYPARSQYQLVVNKIEHYGQGHLAQIVEERRQKLLQTGIFDKKHKKSLPFLPNIIGVITSPDGAVIQDILHRIADRFPSNVIVWPVNVQGITSENQIVAAIDGFNIITDINQRPDVIILARGGGSLEDLMVFNSEAIVLAIARSIIPVISAIGHDTDTVLTDYVADIRAPTPTAAAEFAVPVRVDLYHKLKKIFDTLHNAISNIFDRFAFIIAKNNIPSLYDIFGVVIQLMDEINYKLNQYIDQCIHRSLQHIYQITLSLQYTTTQTSFVNKMRAIEQYDLRYYITQYYHSVLNKYNTCSQQLEYCYEKYFKCEVTVNGQKIFSIKNLTILEDITVALPDGVVLTTVKHIQKNQNVE